MQPTQVRNPRQFAMMGTDINQRPLPTIRICYQNNLMSLRTGTGPIKTDSNEITPLIKAPGIGSTRTIIANVAVSLTQLRGKTLSRCFMILKL